MGKRLRLSLVILIYSFLAVPWVFAQTEDDILAKIGNEVITRRDFEVRFKAFPFAAQQDLNTPEKKAQILENMIKARLLAIEGEKRGLGEKPEIKAVLKMMKDDFLTQEYVRAYIESKVEVTDEEAQKFYDTNPEIREKEYLKLSQIVVEKEEDAKAILAQIKKGENFNKLAKERSIDPAAKNTAGELEWLEKGKGKKEIEDAVSKLEKGGVSDIVKVDGKYTIVKLDERRNVPKPPFGKIKDEITARLRYQKATELVEKEIEELKKKTAIEVFYDKLITEKK